MDLGQWAVRCITEGVVHYVDLPLGSPAPTECPVDPGHTVGRISLRRRFAASHDFAGTRGRPGLTDDSTKGWSRGSRIQAADGNEWLCVDATPGAARWRNLTGGVAAMEFSWASRADPDGFATVSPTWESTAPFLYLGRIRFGPPVAAKVIARCDAGTAGQVRLWDITNQQQICASPQYSGTAWQSVALTAPDKALVPNTEAVWEIQHRRASGAGSAFLVGLIIGF